MHYRIFAAECETVKSDMSTQRVQRIAGQILCYAASEAMLCRKHLCGFDLSPRSDPNSLQGNSGLPIPDSPQVPKMPPQTAIPSGHRRGKKFNSRPVTPTVKSLSRKELQSLRLIPFLVQAIAEVL